MEDVRKWETETGEFDPILQHRHFCPWVNGHVAGAGSGQGSICGWQVTLDALQQKHTPARMVESESAASKRKVKSCLDSGCILRAFYFSFYMFAT